METVSWPPHIHHMVDVRKVLKVRTLIKTNNI